MPVEVIYGKHPGPTIWLSGALHGDEIIGVEIIRTVVREITCKELHGCIIAVPIVNVFGFVDQTRDLPDRRDLNRCFPGTRQGSLTSRLAKLFMSEIVRHCTHGIDLHTGSNHRQNLPQIRVNVSNEETRRCADAFGAPVIIHSKIRDGSLRQAADSKGISCLVYEAGEPMRFDDEAIEIGRTGVKNVLAYLKMVGTPAPHSRKSIVCEKSKWIRSRQGGILRINVRLGDEVKKGDFIGEVGDAFGDKTSRIKTPYAGIVIGMTNNPLVYQGDAIVHVAQPSTS